MKLSIFLFTHYDLDPHGNQVPVSLRDIANDIIEAEFVPKTEGNHSLSIKVGDERIKGSPFRVAVLDLSTVRVIGLKNDRIGLEQRFNGNTFRRLSLS